MSLSRRIAVSLTAVFLTLLALPATGAAAPARYTLAIGDSVPYGVVNGAPGSGARFTSFIDLLTARVQVIRPGNTAINYSCPGATTADIVGPAASACQGAAQYAPHSGSQLAAALAFLAAHPGDVSPIVVTAGGNDLLNGVDLDAMQARLSTIVGQLRAAAPAADLVVTGYGDPLALGRADQVARFDAHAAFEQRLRAAATGAGAAFADPHPIFNNPPAAQDTAICVYTRMCDGADPHPTDVGHRVYAQLIWNALGYENLVPAVATPPAPTPDTTTFGVPATGGTKVPVPTGEVKAAQASVPARFGAPRLLSGRRALHVQARCASDRPRTCRILVVVRQRGHELGRARVRLAPGRAAMVKVALRRRAARGAKVQVAAYVGDAPKPAVRLTAG